MSQQQTEDLKVLIIDDFEMGRLVIRSALSDLGYKKTVEAEDGQIAVDIIQSPAGQTQPYDLIFCDWSMPNLDGMQVLKILRNDPVYNQIPFIMVTAEGNQENILLALSSGANDYIVKPITHEVLKKKISRVFAKIQSKAVVRSA